MTLFIVWNSECHRKRASKWALKNIIHTFLCVCFACLNNRPIRVGRKVSKWPVKVKLLFYELCLVSKTSKTKDLVYQPSDFESLPPVSISRLHYVLPTCVPADKDLAVQDHSLIILIPLNSSKKSLESLLQFRKFFNYNSVQSLTKM